MPLNLGSFDSVRAFMPTFTAEAHSDHGLNVLAAHPGAFAQEYTRTDDDSEVMYDPRLYALYDDGQLTRR